MRLGYLYSRYPVISQTFCDAEMLALERRDMELEIGSVYPPLTSLRHEHIARLRAPVRYAPPQDILKIWEKDAKKSGTWPGALVEQHRRKYGPSYKAEQRARNALYFGNLFARNGVDHFHVHFANRAAHTAIFVKEISKIPFSVTAHGQDFMKDLGNDDLLREICAAAEFVAAETDYSRDLLRQRCPESAAKIHRVYNGIDLGSFPAPARPAGPSRTGIAPYQIFGSGAPRIISIGRLVAFKGFDHLIDACSELTRRGLDFTCEIIGDGPLRNELQAKIDTLKLSPRVKLIGSLSQAAVIEKLQGAEIFALASVTDTEGASDVFPTVIMEAMAAARPVVSTQLAGIPELVVHGETGLLVAPGDTGALTQALEELLQNPELRQQYGRAGRARIEEHFQIEHTIAPLTKLLEKTSVATPKSNQRRASHSEAATGIAYLIDRWPDQDLSLIERELREMTRRGVPIVPFVSELNPAIPLTRSVERTASSLEFLPDAIVIEAEWRANRALAQKLEEDRAQQESRSPSAIFLRQARFALVLRKLLAERKISHVHATTSRALVCALILQKLAGVTVTATIERRPELSQNWIKAALPRCVGGRVQDRKLLESQDGSFMLEKTSGFRTKFWREWAQLLLRWSRSNQKSKIKNQK
jgi:glycosyltransferase involved in cell wall biosynthesis